MRAEASHNARGANVYPLQLLAAGPGRYAARIPSTDQGLWRVDVTVARGADTFIERVTVDNGTPQAP